MTYADLNIGIYNLVICVELVPFSLFFWWAYSVSPYKLQSHLPAPVASGGGGPGGAATTAAGVPLPLQYVGGFLGWKGLVQVLNPKELLEAIAFAFKIGREGAAGGLAAASPSTSQDTYLLGEGRAGHGGQGYHGQQPAFGTEAYGSPRY
jgi:hypothetical protein